MEVVVEKKVYSTGSTIAIEVPHFVRIEPGEHLWVYLRDDEICYSREPPSERVAAAMKVKARVATRRGDRVYVVVTIPAVFARMAGIRRGDRVLLRVTQHGMCIKRV